MAAPREEVLFELLCMLHALYAMHRSAHWQAASATSYSDHLMFERLYGSLDDEIDTLAERMVAELGVSSVDASKIALRTADIVQKISSVARDPHERAVNAENVLLDLIEEAIEVMEASSSYSAGWDDVLGKMGSQHDTHVYLLQQRLLSMPV